MTDRPEREVEGLEADLQEFDESDGQHWGWDGYHVEDVVNIARTFRDAIRTLTAERDRLKAELVQYRTTNEAVRVCQEHTDKIVEDGGCLVCENERLRDTVAFFTSVIKSGEPWTAECEESYRRTTRALEPETEE